jgi:hypothetical protein
MGRASRQKRQRGQRRWVTTKNPWTGRQERFEIAISDRPSGDGPYLDCFARAGHVHLLRGILTPERALALQCRPSHDPAAALAVELDRH